MTGSVPDGWEAREWGDIAELRYGKALKNYRDGVGSTTVYGTNGPVGTTDANAQGEGPGVIVGRKGAYRGVHYSPGPFYVIDTAFWLEPTTDLDVRWAYFELLTHDINGMDSGSAIPSTSRDDFYRMPVLVPPRPEQERIATALGAIEDKISSNRRTIDLLESLGEALLQRALGVVYGEHPPYDEAVCLGDFLAVLETGSRPRGGVTAEGDGVVSLGAENVQSAGISSARAFKRVSSAFASSMKRGRLLGEDVLVYKDGGKPGNFVPHVSAFGYGFPVGEATINEHVYRVRAKEPISQALLYWMLRSVWMDEEMRKRGTGVAIPGLNSSNFRNLPMPIMSAVTIDQLNSALEPMFAEMLRRGSEIARLTELRNAVLPEVISGRLRTSDEAGLPS